MNILFRTDSSSTIGTGHIMRDLVLAQQFTDTNIIFATQNLPRNINYIIEEKGYQLEVLHSSELSDLIEVINKYDIEMIIIDHYAVNENYEKALKNLTGIKIFVLDDTYERHFCDILLNHNIYADEKKYRGLVPENCELRCGEKYTLLRDEFIEAKLANTYLKDERTKTIFVAMGGSDVLNLNPKILKVLERFENVEVNLVTTVANQNLEELQQFVQDRPWVSLHINSTQIAKLVAKSNLAIVTPSVTINEVWYMQISFIAIEVAENQAYMSEFLRRKNKVILKEYSHKTLYNIINEELKGLK